MSKPAPRFGVETFRIFSGCSSRPLPRVREQRALALLPGRKHRLIGPGELGLERGDLPAERRLLARAQDGVGREGRAGIDAAVAVQSAVFQRVEEREELVVLLLRDRIELVVVALGAAERQAEDALAERLDAVGVVVGQVLFRDGAAFVRDHIVALEAGGDELRARCGSGSRSPASCSTRKRS